MYPKVLDELADVAEEPVNKNRGSFMKTEKGKHHDRLPERGFR